MDSALRGILAESADGRASVRPVWPNLPALCVGLRLVRRRSPIGLGMLALVALLALVLAGCGGSENSTDGATAAGPDPASVAPQSAVAYAEALVRPGDDVKAGLLAAAGKVLRVQDPGAELQRLIEKSDEPGESFARDIEPWLGDRIGVFVLISPPGSGDEPNVAVLVAVSDRDALDATVARQRQEGKLRGGGSYRGVAYDIDEDGAANATVGDFYVVGDVRALRAAVDASKGASLGESARYGDAVSQLEADRIASLYFEPRALRELLALGGQDLPVPVRESLQGLANSQPIVAGLTARSDEIALELHAGDAGPLADTQDGGLSVGELPGDAWLALATPALGPLIESALRAGGLHEQAAEQVRALGLDLDRDLLEPLGGLAAFARGTGVLDLGGGVVLKMSDAGAARKLLTRLRAIVGAVGAGVVRPSGDGFEVQIPRSPQPIVVDALGERIAVGYGRSSAEDLLNPQERFDESPAGKAALATLGEGFTPSLVVLVPPIAQLLESLDAIGIADLSQVLPYVRPYRSLAIGTQRDDDRVTVRVVAALR